MSVQLVPYVPGWQQNWNKEVGRARNGHFLFYRGYMDYHADRFADASWLLLRGHRIVALLPAHLRDAELVSHAGLSFGGWILAPECRHEDLRVGFLLLGEQMQRQGWRRLTYAPSPYPYHDQPCDDDLFLLHRLGGRCCQTKLAAFLGRPDELVRTSEFRRRLRRAEESSPCSFEECDDVERFWATLACFLEYRHGAAPVHCAAEMRLLKSRFPDNIRLCVARRDDAWVAGAVLFLSRNVLRYQYFFQRTDEPQAIFLFRLQEWIRRRPELARPWIDFGTSMDPARGELSGSLHLHKENLGARGVALTTWIWEP